MKKIMFTLLCLPAICLSLSATEPPTPPSKTTVTNDKETYLSALLVSETEMQSLTREFETKAPNSTWGGSFQKRDLQELISAMPSGAKFVNFRFGKDTSGATSLMVSSIAASDQAQSEYPCLRNGGSESAYCPTACNLEDLTTPAGAILLTYEDYLQMSEAYKAEHEAETIGGNIDKGALQEVLNSIPAGVNRVYFRFCYDRATKHTSVLFIGGKTGVKGQPTVIYRNGKDAKSFCPTNCNRM